MMIRMAIEVGPAVVDNSAGGATVKLCDAMTGRELLRLRGGTGHVADVCFSPDGAYAYFTDTYYARVMKVPLDLDGWPSAAPTRFLDLSKDSINPDGAVTTADGELLIAQWGSANVAHYGPFGNFRGTFDLPTDHITCPALGGPNMSTLFVTTAQQGLSAAKRKAQPDAGKTFSMETSLRGVPAPKVSVPVTATQSSG